MSNFNDEFSVYAKRKLGLEAPFDQELKEEKIANVYVEEEDGNISIDVNKAREIRRKYKKAKEEWIKLRDEYMANRILKEKGYEALLKSHYRNYLQNPIPCEGADGQCHMDCPYFNKDCAK